MKIIAYTYTDPIIETPPDPTIWGWEIDAIYMDIGGRQQLNQLMADCQIYPPDYLLILHLEQLGDTLTNIRTNLGIIEQLNIEVITLDQDYSSTNFKTIDNTKKLEQSLIIWQEITDKKTKQNLLKSHCKNRLNYLPPPGKAPFGYLRGKESYIINRATAPVVRAFFERFLLYASIRDSVRYLAEKYNKKIPVSTAYYWLKNPVYRGDLSYKNNQEIITNTHTPIITREEAAQVDRILKNYKVVKPKSSSSLHCLAGLVQCKICSSKFRVNSVTRKKKLEKYLYLTPVKCLEKPRCTSVNYDLVLSITINNICEQFKSISLGDKFPDIEQIRLHLKEELENKVHLLTEIKSLEDKQILDEDTVKIRTYKLKQEIGNLETQIYQLPPNNLSTIAQTLSHPQFWHDLSPSEKRFYLREFVHLIKINPSHHQNNSHNLAIDFIFTSAELNNSWQNKDVNTI